MSAGKNIAQLHNGESAVITEFSNEFIACKLMTMGLLPGVVIKLVRSSPFGGAYYIKAENHYLVLRTREAEQVLLSPV